MLVIKQLTTAIDFHSIFFLILWWSMLQSTRWLQTFFIISYFVFNRRKELIQVWNKWRVSKWWQNFIFWLSHPFNCCLPRYLLAKMYRSIALQWTHVPVARWLEHCVSSAKVVGSIPREHTYWQYKCISWMHCKSLWIKASGKCKLRMLIFTLLEKWRLYQIQYPW